MRGKGILTIIPEGTMDGRKVTGKSMMMSRTEFIKELNSWPRTERIGNVSGVGICQMAEHLMMIYL